MQLIRGFIILESIIGLTIASVAGIAIFVMIERNILTHTKSTNAILGRLLIKDAYARYLINNNIPSSIEISFDTYKFYLTSQEERGALKISVTNKYIHDVKCFKKNVEE